MVKFKEALYYKKLNDRKVHCLLCPHSCMLDNGEYGKCKVRMNINGNLKSMNYGKLHTVISEKIEQVPFYHFMPGSNVLSVGTEGNTLSSGKLENIPTINQTPSQLIKQAQKLGVQAISFSKSEPTACYEYAYELADNSRKMKHIVQTNGFIESIPIAKLSGKVHGFLFDIVSMNENFYNNFLGINPEPILKSLKRVYNNGAWVEVRMNLVQRIHEDLYDVRRIVSWMLQNLDAKVPLHFFCSRNSANPEKNFDEETAKKARRIAMEAGLNYVYVHGLKDLNSQDAKDAGNTFCPRCKKAVIVRSVSYVESFLSDGKCSCGKEIAGVWS